MDRAKIERHRFEGVCRAELEMHLAEPEMYVSTDRRSVDNPKPYQNRSRSERVSRRAPRPRLVYDDDCGFCTWSAEYADAHGDFELVGFSELTPDQRTRLPADYEQCVHLLTDDQVYSCGAATEEVLARLDSPERSAVKLFRLLPDDTRARVREPLYRWVADHRAWWGKLRSR